MKTKLPSSFLLLAALTLFTTSPRAPAQDDTVAISAAEFQRLVYSAHLLMQMDEKPELDASLVVLLELQRRNPQTDPAFLADVSRQALARYRTNAPTCLKASDWRDEILAAYLDAFRQVPGRTNFTSATLTLVHRLVAHLNTPGGMQQAELLNSGFERLLTTEDQLPQRQAVVDASAIRAAGHPAFREAMDGLLIPETGVSLTDSPGQIINATSTLSNNSTLQALLRHSETNPTAGLQISLPQLKSLFTAEIQALRESVATNMAVDLEISRRQTDLMAYLTNQPALADDLQRETEVRQLQAQKIAAARASFKVLSSLAARKDGRLGEGIQTLGNSLTFVAAGVGLLNQAGGLNKLGGFSALLSAGLGIFGLFDTGPSPDEVILEGIDDLKSMIRDFSQHVDYRFDRVEQSLSEIYQTLNDRFDQIDLQLGHVNGDVDQIRRELLDSQSDLHRLERELYNYLNAGFRRDLVAVINGALGYEATYGMPMDYSTYRQIPDGPENKFYSWAVSDAKDPLSSPANFPGADLTDTALYTQLNARPLASSLNYLNQFLSSRLGLPALGPTPVANPRDWFVGAEAYLQLAIENPLHFRRVSTNRLKDITANGQELQGYLQNLLFTGTGVNLQVNSNLYTALLNYYAAKHADYESQVHQTEQQYETLHQLPPLEPWRQWDLAAPRVPVGGVELAGTMRQPQSLPADATRIVAGPYHNLALKRDGTVVAWGNNAYGQSDVPVGLSNVVAVAAGGLEYPSHSLALKADGTVVMWGDNAYGQGNLPSGLSNVVAIAAGGYHSLALKTDGTVVAWGSSGAGQCDVPTGLSNVAAIAASTIGSLALQSNGLVVAWGILDEPVPLELSNVVAIAASTFFRDGMAHGLALQANGTVEAWGNNGYGQCDVPPGLSNVVAVAAGGGHSLALKRDGTVVGWGDPSYSFPPETATNVAAIAAGGRHSVVQRADGSVLAWGNNEYGQCGVPTGLDGVTAIAAGVECVLLKNDGSVVEFWHSASMPPGLSNVVAIAAGPTALGHHRLALQANGTVAAWGDNGNLQCNVPPELSTVVAIAAGYYHSLALKADGTVVGWGAYYHPSGQTATLASASNAVAIAAGALHSLALKLDGTVVVWGDNNSGQRNVPAGLSNVVAVAAGGYHNLALKTNGRVVAWGRNAQGQCNVPAGLSNVVAIAAGEQHSLALKADGTVVGWGNHRVPAGLSNVVAMAAGYRQSYYLIGTSSASAESIPVAWFDLSPLPVRVASELRGVYEDVVTNLSAAGDLRSAAEQLSGAKGLLESVLALGMPYTLERDDVLHGFLYGSEALVDLDVGRSLVAAEIERLRTAPNALPAPPAASGNIRFARFTDRLQERLTEFGQTRQPEIPRMIGHTLRLLTLLRDAWPTAPPPALEVGHETNTLRVVLYGEPYAHYALQECLDLNLANWSTLTATNWHNEEPQLRPTSGSPQRFYRALLPVP